MKLINGDCLEEMKNIPTGSIDLIITDPPYQFRKEDNGGGGMLSSRKYDKEIHTKLGSDNILDCGITEEFLEETKRLF